MKGMKLSCMGYELRNYQIEAVNLAKSMERGQRKLIALPTGTGKTLIFANIAINAVGKVLIVVPSTELRTQAIEKILKFDENADVGSVQANINEFNHKIIVATRQSLSHKKSTRIEKMLDDGDFEYVIIDEVHQAVSQIKLILDKLNDNVKVIGFTATPFNAELKDVFEKVDYNKSILDMINQEYLCEPRAEKIETGTDLSNVKTVAGEFVQAHLEHEINTAERNLMVVEAWKKYASDRKHTIVFCSGIEHSNTIMDAFNDEGINCKTINSKNDKDDRKEILEGFKNGDFPVITNCNILTTGFDFEALDCLILASPTKSKTKYVQEIGRGLRTFLNKEDCLIIDMEDTCSQHDIMNMDDIFGVTINSGESLKEAKDRNGKEAQEEFERQKLREEAARLREQKLQEMRAKEIDLFNTDLSRSFAEKAYLDWWQINYNTYVLSYLSDEHYVIQRDGCNNFNIYRIITSKNDNSCELIYNTNSILEAIDYVENDLNLNITSFMNKLSEWKYEDATEKQKQAIKYAIVTNKWESHIYFSQWKIKKILQKYKNDNMEECVNV